jgi:hypothetical protein
MAREDEDVARKAIDRKVDEADRRLDLSIVMNSLLTECIPPPAHAIITAFLEWDLLNESHDKFLSEFDRTVDSCMALNSTLADGQFDTADGPLEWIPGLYSLILCGLVVC